MEKEDFLENEIFILQKKLNAINYRIEERERENKLSEAKELLGHNHNNLVLVWLK